MECSKIRRQLTSRLAGKAGCDTAGRHLERCSACRADLEELRADAELLASVDAPELSPFLLTRVMAEVRANGTQPELRRRLVLGRLVISSAAALTILVGAWGGTVLGGALVSEAHKDPVAELMSFGQTVDDLEYDGEEEGQ